MDAVFQLIIMVDVEEGDDEENEGDEGGGVTEYVAPKRAG